MWLSSKQLYPPSDCNQPLNLTNGDRVLVDHIPDQSEQPRKGEELVSVPQKESHTQSTLSESEDVAATSIKRSDLYSHHQKRILTSQVMTEKRLLEELLVGRDHHHPATLTVTKFLDHCFNTVAMKIK